jgi:hypothetical protein
MENENIDKLSETEKYYHHLKLKLLKKGYSEDEYEELARSML